ncbi:hypothetical protein [Jannaschia rubra]|uniref:hypothetical protein n=1 Tax=Jannaschia rubra TaxID=282197 RepID=UPI0024900EF7|nr:hypothetical protein [Jannaschia rubra]
MPDTTEPMQIMQVVQAIAAKEFATMLQDQSVGNFTASQVGWSGYVDPSANLHQFVTTGGGINDARYSNPKVDRLLDEARATTVPEEGKALYAAARDILAEDALLVYLYHPTWIWALRDDVSGFEPYPDARIRLEGVRPAPRTARPGPRGSERPVRPGTLLVGRLEGALRSPTSSIATRV